MLTGRGGHGRPAENRVRLLPRARPAANVSLRDGNASEAIGTWHARTFVSLKNKTRRVHKPQIFINFVYDTRPDSK